MGAAMDYHLELLEFLTAVTLLPVLALQRMVPYMGLGEQALMVQAVCWV